MTEFSKKLMMPTDVAHMVLFHPDDLAHAAEWPIAWYSEPFIYPAESVAGRLIAWCTGSDGDFAVRVTNGAITEREQTYAGPQWTFPYMVRHGRAFLDNSDALPGLEKMTETSDNEDFWIEIENGDYAVTVTAVEWDQEPGSDNEDFDALPNYVVQFAPRNGRDIETARRPPDLECEIDFTATDELYAESQRAPDPADYGQLYPAFISRNVGWVGQEFSTKGEAPIEAAVVADEDGEADVFDQPYIVASELVPGAPAVIVECFSYGGQPEGEAEEYEFRSVQAVQIVAVEGQVKNGERSPLGKTGFFRRRPEPVPTDALPLVRIAPLVPVADKSVTITLGAFLEKIVADLEEGGPLAKRLGGIASYEALKLRAVDDDEILARWLLERLPLSGKERLSVGALPPNARRTALDASYLRFAG
ncbi:hypothetical protein GAO09_19930 [Rhizobiales bacterium RZME27]|uniref:Uncharacterized protein n=1 Tax=Endobacterium cereale TaxID=2663029 RepID=A0A6A8AGF8_9HYPH|nr:hypothetical protein [Endobacterium cereale]MQY48306.1 hypothetical protein [Endobacterium cereale]